MKNSILNLGKALNKAEQKSINGGGGAKSGYCENDDDCYDPTVETNFEEDCQGWTCRNNTCRPSSLG